MSKLRVAQLGCGFWGPNLLRNFSAHNSVEIVGVVDREPKTRDWLAKHYPNVPFDTEGTSEVLDNWDAQAVVLATPAGTHYELARRAILSGRHCLVEKPLALKAAECRELIDLADQAEVVLMVGHTFLYNAAVLKLKSIIDEGSLGEIYYAHAQRLNLGQVRRDVDVIYNLAPHDISILLYLFGSSPSRVSARGVARIQPHLADIAFIDLEFPDGKYAAIHVSWLDPQKTRRLTVVGSKQMAVYNDIIENKLVIYDKGVDQAPPARAISDSLEGFGSFQMQLRSGGIHIPEFENTEPLKVEVAEFVEAIEQGRRPFTDGFNGLQTVKVLEAASNSLALAGAFVDVEN